METIELHELIGNEEDDRFDPVNPPKSCSTIAILSVSGAKVAIGTSSHPTEDTMWLWTDEIVEPIYMRADEAEMLIAALRRGQALCRGQD